LLSESDSIPDRGRREGIFAGEWGKDTKTLEKIEGVDGVELLLLWQLSVWTGRERSLVGTYGDNGVEDVDQLLLAHVPVGAVSMDVIGDVVSERAEICYFEVLTEGDGLEGCQGGVRNLSRWRSIGERAVGALKDVSELLGIGIRKTVVLWRRLLVRCGRGCRCDGCESSHGRNYGCCTHGDGTNGDLVKCYAVTVILGFGWYIKRSE
jgi:hypothetical protein